MSGTRIGQKFGRLTIEAEEGKYGKTHHKAYRCRCDCGGSKLAPFHHLKQGNIRSCGCLQTEARKKRGRQTKVPMKGQKFGRYTVLREAGRAKNGLVTWECRCDCGTVRVVAGSTLRRGNTKSCGCLRSDLNAERNRQLRLSKPWEAEFNNFLSQANYRGLTCNLKLTDFTTLVTSPCVYCGQPPHAEPKTVLMREAGEKRHGVDRMDPSKGYIGGNCVSCCKDCNLAKGSLTFNEFIETIKRRYHHLQNQGHV